MGIQRTYLQQPPLAWVRARHINVEEESDGVQPETRNVAPPVDPCTAEGAVEAEWPDGACDESVVREAECDAIKQFLHGSGSLNAPG